MTVQETLNFIHRTSWMGSRPGLERVTELLHRLGDPQDRLQFVHIAGTNGKGSTSAMLASVLQAAGYRTGLYTSPHLWRVHERFRVNGADISDADLCAVADRVKPAADAMEDQPTEFELITAMALVWFAQQECDVVVWEVGLGGRLDATNIIKPPLAAVIASISLDHTAILGDTLAAIAGEKAGIIKPGTAVVLYGQSPEVETVVLDQCRRCGVPLTVTDPESAVVENRSLDGQIISYRNRRGLRLALLGEYQHRNAATVLDTVDVLRQRGLAVPESAVESGLAAAAWPARFELLRREPPVLLDGAHNPDAVDQLARCLEQYLPGQKIGFVMGVMADKDYEWMLRRIAPLAEWFVVEAPEGERALSSENLRKIAEEITGVPVIDGGSVENAVRIALERCGDTPVCIFGSLYQAGTVRRIFGLSEGEPTD